MGSRVYNANSEVDAAILVKWARERPDKSIDYEWAQQGPNVQWYQAHGTI